MDSLIRYMGGLLSYPRTESTAYPEGFDFVTTVRALRGHPEWGEHALHASAHHGALLPTGARPAGAPRVGRACGVAPRRAWASAGALMDAACHCLPLLATACHCLPLLATACHCLPLLATACHCLPLRLEKTKRRQARKWQGARPACKCSLRRPHPHSCASGRALWTRAITRRSRR